MKTFWEIFDHVWRQGHGVDVIRYVNHLAKENGGKGWFYKCECGEEWSR